MWNIIGLASIASLAATAIASPAPQVERRDDSALTPELIDDFKFYAQHAGGIYCNADTAKAGAKVFCTSNGCPRVMANDVTITAIAKGLVTNIAAYVTVDHVRKEVVFTARGTVMSIRNFLTDVRFVLKSIDDAIPGGRVHSGFLNAWHEVADTITGGVRDALAQNPDYRLVAVGHSLGSGTAAVGAAYLRKEFPNVDYFGFGMPRVGNAAFADDFSHNGGATYRIEHYSDTVAALPPILLGYKHTETEYWLSTGPANKIDYSIDEIKVCKGDPNDCSGSVPIKDITGSMHRYILWDLYACGGITIIP